MPEEGVSWSLPVFLLLGCTMGHLLFPSMHEKANIRGLMGRKQLFWPGEIFNSGLLGALLILWVCRTEALRPNTQSAMLQPPFFL